MQVLFIYRCWHCWNGECLYPISFLFSTQCTETILLHFPTWYHHMVQIVSSTVQCTVSWDGGCSRASGRVRIPTYRFSTNHFDSPDYTHCEALMVCVDTCMARTVNRHQKKSLENILFEFFILYILNCFYKLYFAERRHKCNPLFTSLFILLTASQNTTDSRIPESGHLMPTICNLLIAECKTHSRLLNIPTPQTYKNTM